MRKLIDICDIKDVMEAIEDGQWRVVNEAAEEDFDDAEDDARYAREKHIESLIKYAFEKIGLTINYNNFSIMYEDSTREAEVRLEGEVDGISLTQMTKLRETGLAEEYFLSAHDGDLWIKFKVVPELDHAQIPE